MVRNGYQPEREIQTGMDPVSAQVPKVRAKDGTTRCVSLSPCTAGLSASTVARLKQVWTDEYERFRQSRLDSDQWVYVWADGIYSSLRGEEDRVRESIQSWREVLLGLKSRGMNIG